MPRRKKSETDPAAQVEKEHEDPEDSTGTEAGPEEKATQPPLTGVPKAMSIGKGIRVRNKTGGISQFQVRKNSEWATLVGHVGRQHAPPAPWDGPVVLDVSFFVPRPDSASKRVVLPLRRPDLDNLFHKLTDQWNGVYWHAPFTIPPARRAPRHCRESACSASSAIGAASAARSLLASWARRCRDADSPRPTRGDPRRRTG
jgi:Endodeoxyribonuclease RusA